ncbi:MAG TPA: redoxin domain-containing protein [Verrucomicrobiae bacterium]|jgi:thiol-disulfide isomerase/thioredoxin|nr:redoxin domain-containing protein [Verrucomicrobiae bacterium]
MSQEFVNPDPATPNVCPHCGSAIAPGATTCHACGNSISQSINTAGQAQIGASPVRPRNPLVLVVVAVVVAGMLYFGFHAARRSSSETSDNSFSGGPSLLKPAPDFTLQSLTGSNLRLSDLRGKAVLLNFWATWCGPCKIEMPWFVELQDEYGSQGLQIVGVAMDDSSKEDIAKFAKEMGVNYPVLLGKEAVGDEYGGVPALPESFFIGRDGKIVDKIIGLKGKAEIEDAIKKALNTQGQTAATATMRPQQ